MGSATVLAGRLAFAVVWCTALYFDVTQQPRLGHSWYIYKLVMLTNLNFVLMTVFSVLSLVSRCASPIRSFVDYMFITSILPVGMVTCALFWTLYAIEPELVMPAWVAKLIPQWLNHVTHTMPIFYILFEAVAVRRERQERKSCLKTSAVLVALYFGIIFYVKFVDGFYLYPLLELFSLVHFILAYIAAVVGYFGLTQLATFLTVATVSNAKKRKLR